MSVELVTITLFLVSFIVNKRYCKSNGKQSLSWKYQVKENHKLILSLLPCFFTHSTLNMIMVCGLYSYNLFYPVFDKISVAFWIEAFSHVCPLLYTRKLVLGTTICSYNAVDYCYSVESKENQRGQQPSGFQCLLHADV